MCGGHGINDLLARSVPAAASTRPDLNQEVKLLYARGTIDASMFHRLMDMAEGRNLQVEDVLSLLKKTPGPVTDLSAPLPLSEDEQGIREVETQISRLIATAEDAEIAAQRPGLEPGQVQAHLETRQGALFRAAALKRRLQAQNARQYE
jgi:hypothetical protein